MMKRAYLNNQSKMIKDKDRISRKGAITSIEEVYKILFTTNKLS